MDAAISVSDVDSLNRFSTGSSLVIPLMVSTRCFETRIRLKARDSAV